MRREDAYPAQLERQLRAKGYDVAVKNAGVSGDTTAGALKRLDLAVDPDTDIVLVELGTNDLRLHVPRGEDARQHREIVRTLQKRRIARAADRARLARSVRARAHATACLMRNGGCRRGSYRARDGAHFNAEGYRIVRRAHAAAGRGADPGASAPEERDVIGPTRLLRQTAGRDRLRRVVRNGPGRHRMIVPARPGGFRRISDRARRRQRRGGGHGGSLQRSRSRGRSGAVGFATTPAQAAA